LEQIIHPIFYALPLGAGCSRKSGGSGVLLRPAQMREQMAAIEIWKTINDAMLKTEQRKGNHKNESERGSAIL